MCREHKQIYLSEKFFHQRYFVFQDNKQITISRIPFYIIKFIASAFYQAQGIDELVENHDVKLFIRHNRFKHFLTTMMQVDDYNLDMGFLV